MRAYRLVANEDFHSCKARGVLPASDDAVLTRLNAPAPLGLVRLSRVLLYVRLCIKQPQALIVLLNYLEDYPVPIVMVVPGA